MIHLLLIVQTCALFAPAADPAGVVRSYYSSKAVESAIRSWARQQAESAGLEKLEVMKIQVPNVLKHPARPVSYHVRAKENKPLIGRQSIYVDVMMGQENFRTLVVNIELSAEGLVGIATRDISRGEELTASSIHWEHRQLSQVSAAPLTPDQSMGQRARIPIRTGMMITQNQVELVPLVQRNEMVYVRQVQTGFAITLKVQSMENGDLGQVVRLKNVDSGQVLRGIVREAGLVDLVL